MRKRHSYKRNRGTNAEYHLSIEQVIKIINACQGERDRMLINLLAFTGIRRAEAAQLQASDILWNERLLVIQHGKGNKQRLLPLPQELLDNLKDYTERLPNIHLFHNWNGDQLSLRQINNIVAKAGALAGVTNPNPKAKNGRVAHLSGGFLS
jgi:integrase/recombinase XerD